MHGKLNFSDRWVPECLSGLPSQSTWILLQMSRNCGKAAALVWHSILLLLANISQDYFIGWSHMSHTLCQLIEKKYTKIQSFDTSATEKHVFSLLLICWLLHLHNDACHVANWSLKNDQTTGKRTKLKTHTWIQWSESLPSLKEVV